MAFIGDIYLEETLVTNYELGNGDSGFTSSNLIQFGTISVQCNQTNVKNNPTFILEQSHDGIAWDEVFRDYMSDGDGSSTIERNQFTGKFVRLRLIRNGSPATGLVTVKLIAK